MKSNLQSLPSIDSLLQSRTSAELISQYGRPLFLSACNFKLDQIRQNFSTELQVIPTRDDIVLLVEKLLKDWTEPTLVPVINATGVILHTNLGRSPLSTDAIKAMQGVSLGYNNLEFDLLTGKRGSRFLHTKQLLCQLTGAEDAIVVNNNASSLLLILSGLAKRKSVLISRTQLIEIGGGFRIPDVMKQSGAKLVEIGATNKVHLSDYEDALKSLPIKMILRAHRSNFRLEGFVGDPRFEEIVKLGHQASTIVVDDLGSGSLLNTEKYGLTHETTIQESLQAGADLVCFSGDKLLGGPQAGIIVGKKELIQKLKKHPIARAVRADKTTLAGLSATLLHYLKNEAEQEIPIWQMISTQAGMINRRANNWQNQLGIGEVIDGFSTIGGGSMPGEEMATSLLAIGTKSNNRLLAKLRTSRPPIIARIEKDKIIFDPRTVLPQQEGALILGIQNTFS